MKVHEEVEQKFKEDLKKLGIEGETNDQVQSRIKL